MSSNALVTLDTLINSVNGSLQAHELEASKVALDALMCGSSPEVVHKKEKLAVLLKSKSDTLSTMNQTLMQIRQLFNDEEASRAKTAAEDARVDKLVKVREVLNSKGTLRSMIDSIKLIVDDLES